MVLTESQLQEKREALRNKIDDLKSKPHNKQDYKKLCSLSAFLLKVNTNPTINLND